MLGARRSKGDSSHFCPGSTFADPPAPPGAAPRRPKVSFTKCPTLPLRPPADPTGPSALNAAPFRKRRAGSRCVTAKAVKLSVAKRVNFGQCIKVVGADEELGAFPSSARM